MKLNKTTYLLICLIEECAEVTQRICKMIRFGEHEIQPGQPENNIYRTRAEMGDLVGVVEELRNCGADSLDLSPPAGQVTLKREKLRKYMAYSKSIQRLE